jgi:hypothetical protein
MLSLRALLDYDVLQSPLSIALYVAVGGALLVAIAIVDPTQRSRGWTMVIFGFITLAYGYGSVIEANALLDRSTGIAYSAPVKGKQIIDGRSTTYELDLGAWGPKTGTNDLDVGRATYEQIQPGDIALLKLKKGALGVRWYYLSDWQAGDGQTTNK